MDEGIIETGDLDHAHMNENVQDKFPDIFDYPKLSTITKSGTIGNVTVATAKKGEHT
jgi:hypothetical protein